jgi:hypothetical protein
MCIKQLLTDNVITLYVKGNDLSESRRCSRRVGAEWRPRFPSWPWTPARRFPHVVGASLSRLPSVCPDARSHSKMPPSYTGRPKVSRSRDDELDMFSVLYLFPTVLRVDPRNGRVGGVFDTRLPSMRLQPLNVPRMERVCVPVLLTWSGRACSHARKCRTYAVLCGLDCDKQSDVGQGAPLCVLSCP